MQSVPKTPPSTTEGKPAPPSREITTANKHITMADKKRDWWLYADLGLLLIIAAVFHLVFIDKTQFMTDHVTFYQMAYDAVAHGLWPISGNRASTGPLIPPLFVYLLMIPAAISPNPLAGAIFIALCNIAAALLTYLFVRRYYGRFPALIAALLYTTATTVLIFSRDIWQPDLLPFFVIPFFFCLFRGVVERKHNWFLPAAVLFGVMYQLHTTAIYLLIPFGIAIILAWRTIKIRDLFLTILAEALLFSPFIVLEMTNHFADIRSLLQLSQQSSRINIESIKFYITLVASMVKRVNANSMQYVDTHLFPANDHSILATPLLHPLTYLLQVESLAMALVLCASLLIVALLVLDPGKTPISVRNWRILLGDFLASPQRKGLLLLLAWQSAVLVMLRHPNDLYIHYFLFIVPGPFIAIALAATYLLRLLQRSWPDKAVLARNAMLTVCGLVVLVQIIGSASMLYDRAAGNFDSTYVFPEYYDLNSQQQIFAAADRLAQSHHIGRIYAATDYGIYKTFPYLAQFEQTPTMTFNDEYCIVLPSAQAGPVVFIAPPWDTQISAILNRYAHIIFQQDVAHTGGAPFHLYILTANPEPINRLGLTQGWQVLGSSTQIIYGATTDQRWLATRWRVPTTQKPESRVSYDLSVQIQTGSDSTQPNGLDCSATATWTGDQIFSLDPLSASGSTPQQITVKTASMHTTVPVLYYIGPIKVTTFDRKDISSLTIQPLTGSQEITMPVTSSS